MAEEVRKRYLVACQVFMSTVNLYKITNGNVFAEAVGKALMFPSVGRRIWEGNRLALAEYTEKDHLTIAEVIPAIMFYCEWRGPNIHVKRMESTYLRYQNLSESECLTVGNHLRDHPGHILGVMRCGKTVHIFSMPAPEQVGAHLKSLRATPEERAQEID